MRWIALHRRTGRGTCTDIVRRGWMICLLVFAFPFLGGVETSKGEREYLLIVDLQAHIKSALIGASVTIPIKNGKLATGTWQGIWYLEFRASKHKREVVATIQGEKM